jgi:hypothetical protein
MTVIQYTQGSSSIDVQCGDDIGDDNIRTILEEITALIPILNMPIVEEKTLSRTVRGRTVALFVGNDVYFSNTTSSGGAEGLDYCMFPSESVGVVGASIGAKSNQQIVSVGNKIYAPHGGPLNSRYANMINVSTGDTTDIDLMVSSLYIAVAYGGGKLFFMRQDVNAGDVVDIRTHAVTQITTPFIPSSGGSEGAAWAQYYNNKLYVLPIPETCDIIEYTPATNTSALRSFQDAVKRSSFVIVQNIIYAVRNVSDAHSNTLDVFNITTKTASTIPLLDSYVQRKGIAYGDGKLYITRNKATNPEHLQYIDIVDIATKTATRRDLGVQSARGHPAYYRKKLVIPREASTNQFDLVMFP